MTSTDMFACVAILGWLDPDPPSKSFPDIWMSVCSSREVVRKDVRLRDLLVDEVEGCRRRGREDVSVLVTSLVTL